MKTYTKYTEMKSTLHQSTDNFYGKLEKHQPVALYTYIWPWYKLYQDISVDHQFNLNFEYKLVHYDTLCVIAYVAFIARMLKLNSK